MSRKEVVDRAIAFDRPEHVPIVFWNRDQTAGDVMLYHLSLGWPGDGDPSVNAWDWSTNEWGYRLESMDDGTMGHPVVPVWCELPARGEVTAPPLREEERMAAAPARRASQHPFSSRRGLPRRRRRPATKPRQRLRHASWKPPSAPILA